MYCPKCGQEVGEYSRICPACGELLETEPAGQPQPGSQNAQQPQPDYNNGQPLQPNYNNYQQPQPNYSNSPQPQPNNYQQMPVIPDYKVQCICLIVFSAICCFSCVSLISLAFAIVAIVNSGKITQHLNMGNYDLAMEASKKTKMWCWISFGVLMLSIVVTAVSYIAILSSPEYQEMLDQIM
nr:CD225/dispanin family protein [Thermoclostridium sp.]